MAVRSSAAVNVRVHTVDIYSKGSRRTLSLASCYKTVQSEKLFGCPPRLEDTVSQNLVCRPSSSEPSVCWLTRQTLLPWP